MAYTTIDKPDDYFNTKLYTGDGNSTQAVTGVGFQPDWIWIKNRTDGHWHNLNDSVRGAGAGQVLRSNTNAAEGGTSGHVSSFDSDGFTVATGTSDAEEVNTSSDNYVAWNWYTGATASSNTDGDITSSVSVNSTAGFSIGTYTGSGTDGDTVGTGLTALSLVIAKCRNATGGWVVKHQSLSGDNNVYFQVTNAAGSAASAGSGGIGALNDSTFPLVTGTSGASSSQVNASGNTHVFYAFAEKKGYSKFGSYTGNGNADGTFIYTGFKPAFAIFKNTSGTGDWLIYDNKRNPSNVTNKGLKAHSGDAEASFDNLDMLSNGFKLRRVTSSLSTSGSTYIYMAFAENPFVTSSGVPACAR